MLSALARERHTATTGFAGICTDAALPLAQAASVPSRVFELSFYYWFTFSQKKQLLLFTLNSCFSSLILFVYTISCSALYIFHLGAASGFLGDLGISPPLRSCHLFGFFTDIGSDRIGREIYNQNPSINLSRTAEIQMKLMV